LLSRLLRLSPTALLLLATHRGPLTLTTGTAAQHLHHTVEALHNHFGREAVLTALILPLTGLQLTFNVDLRAFTQVLTSHFSQLAEQGNTVPFCFFSLLAGGF